MIPLRYDMLSNFAKWKFKELLSVKIFTNQTEIVKLTNTNFQTRKHSKITILLV